MQKCRLNDCRDLVRAARTTNEASILNTLVNDYGLSKTERITSKKLSREMVTDIRENTQPGLMEVFLAEYGLSTQEGVALMCLAEALLRVPDTYTIDELIEDKIASSNWGEHMGQSPSTLVNAATGGLVLVNKVLQHNSNKAGLASALKGAIKRLGEPVIRLAVKRAMKEMGHQFVLGESIESAIKRGGNGTKGKPTYSYDMLGEAALTQEDADNYFEAYQHAILELGKTSTEQDISKNPGISIKLSALHPRYESINSKRVADELVPRVLQLAQLAQQSHLGLNIDAEEAERLDISLDVIESVFKHPSLEGWDGFGTVVQAYNKSASFVLDWLHALAKTHQRKMMVRLVKGAYWDSEIKRAQVEGISSFPVFTRKNSTDISYICCAKKMLSMSDRIYPQFATHNSNTIAAILAMAPEGVNYEFQRLHGMGTSVYEALSNKVGRPCRIYAPVGVHSDLLAYLVRRLLENGANSSFVNQLADTNISIKEVVSDPFADVISVENSLILKPENLFEPERKNSKGWDLFYHSDSTDFFARRNPFEKTQWNAAPITVNPHKASSAQEIRNPADLSDLVGHVIESSPEDVQSAIDAKKPWSDVAASDRADVLFSVADSLESNAGEVFAILTREAGKNAFDAVAEIREAVDFLRYYAAQAKVLGKTQPRGVFVCISPWNFPLAIFIGQISAALAAGNAVLAKPAETTPLIACFATRLFHQAGVPISALQLLTGTGADVGSVLTRSPKIDGVCFTGSTTTALNINRSMAQYVAPSAPLIAETGGMNAMVVDSSALPEQAVKDVLRSAFQSAGQRCSALRVLYLQEDVYDTFLHMLSGAIDELSIDNPWHLSSDIGPLISANARDDIQIYIDRAKAEGRVLKQYSGDLPKAGHFIAPTVVSINSILELEKEIFGPVLHVVRYSAQELNKVINEINKSGYGLTFGVHTRIDQRVEKLVNSINAGNIYINRDQIGAIVGSQPFGGENMSGTGPKAGGPNYIHKFMSSDSDSVPDLGACNPYDVAPLADVEKVQSALDNMCVKRTLLSETMMPGPTGESNRLCEYPRGVVLCLGPSLDEAHKQAKIANDNGCSALVVCPGASGQNQIDGFLERKLLSSLTGFRIVALWSDEADLILARRALSNRGGAILPLICDNSLKMACRLERHVCVDTTAAGGNTQLLASN